MRASSNSRHPVGEVLVGMGFTRFFTSLSGTRLQLCLVDEVLPLKGLIQVGAPDHAAIRDAGILAVLPHLIRVGVALVQPKKPKMST